MARSVPYAYYQAAWAILAALGITATPVNTNLLAAWSLQEWGSTNGLQVTHNPLATSLSITGSQGAGCTIRTSAGTTERSLEPCYDTLAHGAQACAQTMQNGRYPTLLSALQNSDETLFFSSIGLDELTTWAGGSVTYGPNIESTYVSLPSAPEPSPVSPPTGSPNSFDKVSLAVGVAGILLTVDQMYAQKITQKRQIKPLRGSQG